MSKRKSRPTDRKPRHGPKRRTTAVAAARRGVMSTRGLEQAPPGPVAHAYLPRYEPWRVSGCGSAVIARRRPDG